mmetsp:Transcript_4771/g.6032  ORF Transcript_4771/g.6032 Transcript_4771/m.6032 type:complete len:395 (-) Transcript_4771:1240-2424(-)
MVSVIFDNRQITPPYLFEERQALMIASMRLDSCKYRENTENDFEEKLPHEEMETDYYYPTSKEEKLVFADTSSQPYDNGFQEAAPVLHSPRRKESRVCGETLCDSLEVGDIFAAQVMLNPYQQQQQKKNTHKDEWELYECTKKMFVHQGRILRINRKTGVVRSDEKVVRGRRLIRLRPGSKNFRKITDKNDPLFDSVDVVASTVRAVKLHLTPSVQYNISNRAVRRTQVALVQKRKQKQSSTIDASDCERIESIIAELNFLKSVEQEEKQQQQQLGLKKKRKSKQLVCNGNMQFSSIFDNKLEASKPNDDYHIANINIHNNYNTLTDNFQELFVGSSNINFKENVNVNDQELASHISDINFVAPEQINFNSEVKIEEDHVEENNNARKKARVKL